MKTHVDEPISWIKKLDKKDQSKELHDAWVDLIRQRIEKGSFLEQELIKCLMIWYGKLKIDHFSQESLNGMTLLHISVFCGVKSLLEFIVSFNDNPNPPKGNGATPIDSAAFEGNIEMVKFLASKVENLNAPLPDGRTPWKIAADNNHSEVGLILLIAMDKRKSLEIFKALHADDK